MDPLNQAFDSRAMPLLEPSTAPIAFSLWGWLAERIGSKGSNPRRDSACGQPVAPDAADHSTAQTPR